ncbi:STAS domain-containing protein [Kitasatospora sp. NPDC006697]|uniref:STAS domain-containing protein n=1 Tax=Kitasatospora sp. NPDC006697 TaxID=3364020 RepID=UPI0036A92031
MAEGEAVIVRLDGEVDLEDRQPLQQALARVAQTRPPRLIVDLTGLVFCHSVCLNALLAARQRARAAGVEMVLAAPPPQTRRVLEITGTDQVFTICSSVRTALADTYAASRRTG